MAIKATSLVKIYDNRTVVNENTFDVNPGEVVGLLGPNGAGKTTTFYMIVGLIRPDGGMIELDGEDVTKEPMHIRAKKVLFFMRSIST